MGIIFKGKGFYVTDNKGNTASLMPRPESKGEHADTGHGAAKESAPKEEAKPAAKGQPTVVLTITVTSLAGLGIEGVTVTALGPVERQAPTIALSLSSPPILPGFMRILSAPRSAAC